MPLLRVAAKKAVANTSISGASVGSRMMSLVDLDRMDNLPLSPVTVIGRLQLQVWDAGEVSMRLMGARRPEGQR